MQRPVGLAEQSFLRDLLDRQVAADGQVHDRRGDVERVRALVDERADLPRPEVLGRSELDGRDAPLEQRHGLRLARRIAHRLVDRRSHETTIAPSGPEQPAASRDQQGEEASGETQRGGGSRERTADAPRLLEPWLRFSDDSLRQRDDHRERFEREEVRLPEPGRAVLEDPLLVARRGRADRPWKQVLSTMADGALTVAVASSIGHLPVIADGVPVELVVIAEAVHRGLDRVSRSCRCAGRSWSRRDRRS